MNEFAISKTKLCESAEWRKKKYKKDGKSKTRKPFTVRSFRKTAVYSLSQKTSFSHL